MPTTRVMPRVLGFCMGCREPTVQWLVKVSAYSPGSYRGYRHAYEYRCSECGHENYLP